MKVGDYLLCISGFSVFTEGLSYRVISLEFGEDIVIQTNDKSWNWYINKMFVDDHFILDIKKQRIEKIKFILND